MATHENDSLGNNDSSVDKKRDLDKKIDRTLSVFSTVLKGLHEKDRQILESAEIVDYMTNNCNPVFKEYYEKIKESYLR